LKTIFILLGSLIFCSSLSAQPKGNFAFAQGVHELLLQNHADTIEIFPAITESWKNVSFKTLRAEGAFLIGAKKENGLAREVTI